MSHRLVLYAGLTASKISGEVGVSVSGGSNIHSLPFSCQGGRNRSYASQASNTETKDRYAATRPASSSAQSPLGQRAKQKQVDREFFVDLLSSAATKRDAKAYLSRLKSPTKLKSISRHHNEPRSTVNLGNLFSRASAVDAKPVFSQHVVEENGFEEQELQHVALVKLSDVETLTPTLFHGIAQTLSQLSRLSMAPCVVLDTNIAKDDEFRSTLRTEAERLSALLDASHEHGARILDCIFTISAAGKVSMNLSQLLQAPLQRGQIPVVLPVAYSSSSQKMVPVSADDAILALVAELSGLQADIEAEEKVLDLRWKHAAQPTSTSLDRIIIIDRAGGIPNAASPDGKHVFLNLEQEYGGIKHSLKESGGAAATRHRSNLKLLKTALKDLPHSSSGLMTTPEEASTSNLREHTDIGPAVGTRRQKNTLIHNLLTDRPAYSASLPKTRLSRSPHLGNLPPVSTFVKRGMPLKIIPDPLTKPWTSGAPRIKLTDSCIDLERLVHLVNDSFNRNLDVEKYLERVNDNIAGVIIAGDYEGGAILTWETPTQAGLEDVTRQVPYLDKFAVLKRSQGAGGVADIVFNAMVRTCFPHGVCWRSRKTNPVNKWYFERSSGTWKISDTNWTMFWTTSGTTLDGRTFQDYESVCRQVQPTWLNTRSAASG